jgi:hypothetical protein
VSTTATPGTQVVTGELHRVRRGRSKGFSAESLPEPIRRPARVAVTLALAHSIQRAIDRGEIGDQAEAARMLGVTRARMTQILDLIRLAPDLQEEMLFLEALDDDVPLTERSLRVVLRTDSWLEQRHILDSAPSHSFRRKTRASSPDESGSSRM